MIVPIPCRPEDHALNYHPAYPLDPGLMDLMELDQTLPGQASELVLTLLGGKPLRQTLSVSGRWARQWFAWESDNANSLRLHGYRAFGLGFPLCLLRREGQLVAAPLYIFPLHLERDPLRIDYWQLRHTPGDGPTLNPWLLKQDGLDALGLDWSAWQKARASDNDLLSALAAFLEDHQPAPGTSFSRLVPLRNAEEEEGTAALPQGWAPAGFLGLFPPPSYSSPFGLEELLEKGESVGSPNSHLLGPLVPTPALAQSFSQWQEHPELLVTVPSPLAAQDLVFDRLANALDQGESCLLICSDTHTLGQLGRRLAEEGLEALTFVAADPIQDRDHFTRRMADIVESLPIREEPEVPENPERATCLQAHQQLEEARQFLTRPVFGSRTWQETMALFLQAHQHAGPTPFEPPLDLESLVFDWDEYHSLRETVERGQALFGPIGTLEHPLGKLSSSLFTDFDFVASEALVKRQVEDHLDQLHELRKVLIKIRSSYAEALEDHYLGWYASLFVPLRDLQKLIDGYTGEHGSDFSLTSLASLRLLGILFKKYRTLYEVKKQVFDAYAGLEIRHGEQAYFAFTFPEYKRGNELPKLRGTLSTFAEALARWHDGLPPRLEEAVHALSSLRVHPAVDMAADLEELERRYSDAIHGLNASGLFPRAFPRELTQADDQLAVLEGVIAQLENLAAHLGDFEAFYKWESFWLAQDKAAQQFMRTLIGQGAEKWEANFASWYLGEVLAKLQSHALPGPGWELPAFGEAWERWRASLAGFAQRYWAQKRLSWYLERKGEEVSGNQLARLGQGRKAARALPGLMASDGPACLPIWLMSQQSARAFWNQRDDRPLFDRLFVLDASLVEEGSVQAWWGLAPRRLLLACDQAKGRIANSLSVAALRVGLSACQVDGFWSRPAKIEKTRPSSVEVLRVPGALYDPVRRINEGEVDALIDWMVDLTRGPANPPKVSVVAWLPEQRDRIHTRLRVSLERELEEAEAIKQLKASGLGVYHLGECASLRPEHLVCCTTFGAEEEDGPLTGQLSSLDEPGWLVLQETVMRLPCHKLTVITSLPEDWTADGGEGQQALSRWIKEPLAPYPDPAPTAEPPPALPVFQASTLTATLAQLLGPRLPGRVSDEFGRQQPLKLTDPDRWMALDGMLCPPAKANFVLEYMLARHLAEAGAVPVPVWSRFLRRDPGAYLTELVASLQATTGEAEGPEEGEAP